MDVGSGFPSVPRNAGKASHRPDEHTVHPKRSGGMSIGPARSHSRTRGRCPSSGRPANPARGRRAGAATGRGHPAGRQRHRAAASSGVSVSDPTPLDPAHQPTGDPTADPVVSAPWLSVASAVRRGLRIVHPFGTDRLIGSGAADTRCLEARLSPCPSRPRIDQDRPEAGAPRRREALEPGSDRAFGSSTGTARDSAPFNSPRPWEL